MTIYIGLIEKHLNQSVLASSRLIKFEDLGLELNEQKVTQDLSV